MTRDELFPTSRFRMAFDALQERHGSRKASKEYLRLLQLAAKEGETKVEGALQILLEKREGNGARITVEAVQEAMAESRTMPTEVKIASVDLQMFDELCEGDGSEKVQ